MTNDIDILKMAIMEYDRTVKIKRMSKRYLSTLQVHYAAFVNIRKNTIALYQKKNLHTIH
jgi:hypothetical protein